MQFKKQFKVVTTLISVFTLFSFFTFSSEEKNVTVAVHDYYKEHLDSLQHTIEEFGNECTVANHPQVKKLFLKARKQYKKIEFIVEYHYPSSGQKLNGPALLEAESSEPGEPLHPSGFQVLEESVYDELNNDSRKAIAYELSNIDGRLKRLQTLLPELELSKSNILDAIRLNTYRLITKGVTGFDSPVALNSVEEALSTLQSTKEILSLLSDAKALTATVDKASMFIQQSGYDFDNFDRALFISRYINPFCRSLHAYQTNHRIPFINENTAIRSSAKTLFDKEAFDPLFYAPSGTNAATEGQIALGKKLFNEPLLSANGKRSCQSCHKPSKAFTDGLALNDALSGSKKLLRNTPTLLNAALQPVLFYDSHIAFLEDQAHDVISNRQEMGGLFEQITKQLLKNSQYKKEFSLNYADSKMSAASVKSALGAYVRSLVKMNSRFDQYMQGNVKGMNSDELKGFNLFMGKAKCGTCHFMPLFNGTVPPYFDKMESEVLGIPANADTLHPVQDLDSGKYHLYNIPHHLYSFKTSTVRNAALTAPYMHNGVYQTLEEVIEFYNRGGGAGLGFDLPNQTLPADKLGLSNHEKKQIIAFIKALEDRL